MIALVDIEAVRWMAGRWPVAMLRRVGLGRLLLGERRRTAR